MVISSKKINEETNIYFDANTILTKLEKRKTSCDKNQLNRLRDLEKHKLLFLSLNTDQYRDDDLLKLGVFGDIGKIDNKYLHGLRKENRILEDRIEKLEKILVSRNIPRPYFDEITKRAVEDGLVNSLYKPLSKGIAFSSGFFAIVSLIFVSGLLAIPLIILSGFFGFGFCL